MKTKYGNASISDGYYKINTKKDKTCKQGFRWRYQYFEEGKQKDIKSVSLDKLEEKVKEKGLLWRKFDDEC